MKQFFLLIDTETTMCGRVADFGAIVCDRKGRVVNQCAVLTGGVFDQRDKYPLFYSDKAGELWAKKSLDRRYSAYHAMLDSGARMMASPNAINSWLGKAAVMYRPVLTAYNLSFDIGKCANTGIDLSYFDRRFCLFHAASTEWGQTKAYRKMVLETLAFNPPTKHGNMSYKTNAETMARFCTGRPDLPNEPHTALEDVIHYELPILRKLLRKRSTKYLLDSSFGYDWRNFQVSEGFTAK